MPYVAGLSPSTREPLFRNGPWNPAVDLVVHIPPLPDIRLDLTQSVCVGA
jgi:hypothetical protein